MSKPWLSIGMIVKNEIRSIEKCLKALQPLRDAFPCELVIADTGSTDGTREIAEKYADILFDFEWINDFAAARNAVMDRCSGVWYLSVDADEYFDENLEGFYRLKKEEKENSIAGAYVTIINYATKEMCREQSSSFLAQRLIKLSKNVRYAGSIHECIVFPPNTIGIALADIVFHHDGYVYQSREQMLKKAKRNLDLLESELKIAPKDTRRWMQCLESAAGMPERRVGYAKEAMSVLIEKDRNTQTPLVDAALATRCIEAAVSADLSETEEWIQWLDERYPNVLITRIDAAASEIQWNSKQKRYEKVVELADIYEKGVKDWKEKNCKPGELTTILIFRTLQSDQDNIAYLKTIALSKLNRSSEAFDTIKRIDFKELEGTGLIAWVKTMMHLLNDPRASLKISEAEDYFWSSSEDLIEQDKERYQKLQENLHTFLSIGIKSFLYTEEQSDGIDRPWRLFLQCKRVLGQSAHIMLSEQEYEIQNIVDKIEQWKYVPSVVLTRIFKKDIEFPDSFYRENTLWKAQVVKNFIKEDENFVDHLLRKQNKSEQKLIYLQFRLDLFAAALQDQKTFDEQQNDIVEQLINEFHSLIEQYFLKVYNIEFIKNDTEWDILSGTSCFMLYLLQAEKQRQSGNSTAYIHILRKALQKAEGMKYLVEYLAQKEMDQQKMQQASPELIQLADKVKAILSQYPENDPAVKQLKASEAYQKVAWLIEQPSADYQM